MKVIDVGIDEIDIGERRRIDYGDIGSLARGIRKVGLLAPIIVDRNGTERYRLVAGERRLRAVQMLKWKTISAQLLEELSDAQLREVELEENENRKNLTEQERTRTFRASQKLVEDARRVKELLSHSETVLTGKPGQPAKSDSVRAVAASLGVDKENIRRAEQHVALAEEFPFMKTGKWRQSDVLRIRERIEELPEAEQERARGVLGCAKLMDPDLAVQLMENLAAKSAAERQEIYQLSQSQDPRDISLALTKTAELPPMPDPRLGILDNVLRYLDAATKPYPNDPLTSRLLAARAEIRSVRAAVKQVSFDASRQKEEVVQ